LLKTEAMVRARAYFHEQYADEVLTRIAEEGVLHQTEVFKSLEAHQPHIRPVEPSERLF
jgi:vacuolar-type H+-ATPase subunit I/STV1